MVNADGQLFTIEGIAAALIMLATVFIVVNTTSVYTAGDTHVNDMQLEVIGSDALKMLNTPENGTIGKSPLVIMVESNDAKAFNESFTAILNNRSGAQPDTIQFDADITYMVNYGSQKGMMNTTNFSNSSRGVLYGGEHAVHTSQWIIIDNWNVTGGNNVFPEQCGSSSMNCAGKHAAVVDVYLWRD
ncbi:MAG: hypothetical protein LUQ35_00920 [Methanoregula sp.]|jgi:hypothetical protein|nr:hypothetical protein [Methanoregula sp.]